MGIIKTNKVMNILMIKITSKTTSDCINPYSDKNFINLEINDVNWACIRSTPQHKYQKRC